jgi:hypothetical protein
MKNPGDVPMSEDDQILLILRYPLKFTLTNRIISRELRSLNRDMNPKYFDVVHISSQLVAQLSTHLTHNILYPKYTIHTRIKIT